MGNERVEKRFLLYEIGCRTGGPTTGTSEHPAKRPNTKCVVRGATRLTVGVVRVEIACMYANWLKVMNFHVVR